MRLDFNVLWIEDQQNNVRSQKAKMESSIKNEGFRLNVKFASSIDEGRKFLSDGIYGDHIDLILMDYDLGPGMKGDEGLWVVRNIFPYKDIIFYSARAQDLANLVATQKVPGIFLSDREDLPDSVNGIFEALIKKVLDIDHSRGIIMGVTSDIDALICESLIQIFDGCATEKQEEIRSNIIKKLEEIEKKVPSTIATIKKSITHVSDLFEYHAIYTSNERVQLLRKSRKIKEATLSIGEDIDQKISDYSSKITPLRNDLAHVHTKVDGFSRKLFDRKGNELTSDKMKEIRLMLLEFQELFENILRDLKPKS